jgi:hypothetical protein
MDCACWALAENIRFCDPKNRKTDLQSVNTELDQWIGSSSYLKPSGFQTEPSLLKMHREVKRFRLGPFEIL